MGVRIPVPLFILKKRKRNLGPMQYFLVCFVYSKTAIVIKNGSNNIFIIDKIIRIIEYIY